MDTKDVGGTAFPCNDIPARTRLLTDKRLRATLGHQVEIGGKDATSIFALGELGAFDADTLTIIERSKRYGEVTKIERRREIGFLEVQS